MAIEIRKYKMRKGAAIQYRSPRGTSGDLGFWDMAKERLIEPEDLPLLIQERLAILDAAGDDVTVEGIGTRQRLNFLSGHRYILDMEELP